MIVDLAVALDLLFLFTLLLTELIFTKTAVLAMKVVAAQPPSFSPGPKATSSTCSHRRGRCKRNSARQDQWLGRRRGTKGGPQ